MIPMLSGVYVGVILLLFLESRSGPGRTICTRSSSMCWPQTAHVFHVIRPSMGTARLQMKMHSVTRCQPLSKKASSTADSPERPGIDLEKALRIHGYYIYNIYVYNIYIYMYSIIYIYV